MRGQSTAQGVPREREYIFHTNMLQVSVGGRRKPPFLKLTGLQTRESGDTEREVAEDSQDYNGKGVLFQPHNSRHVLLGGAPRQDRGTAAASDTSGGSGRSRHNGTQSPCGLTSVLATILNGLPLDKMVRVVMTVVQQIMAKFNSAVLRKAKIVAITEIVLNLIEQRLSTCGPR
jgi:hypothetical protein